MDMRLRSVMPTLLVAVCTAAVAGVVSHFWHQHKWGKFVAETVYLTKRVELFKSSRMAFVAYEQEAIEVAVFALRMHLKNLEDFGPSSLDETVRAKFEIEKEKLAAHGRLSKLFKQLQNTPQSDRHLGLALEAARAERQLAGITNETSLVDFLEKLDARERRDFIRESSGSTDARPGMP